MAHLEEPDIESITYKQADFGPDLFYLDQLLAHMPLSLSNPQIPSYTDLGALSEFPVEIVLEILETLSIRDLMRFRRCNRYSSSIVDGILRPALQFAPHTVKGIMACQVSTHITAPQLCRKLRQRTCDGCGALAQYIYLPTCKRACFTCIWIKGSRQRHFNLSQPEDEEKVINGVSDEHYRNIASFRTLPAVFSNGKNNFDFAKRHLFYDDDDLDRKLEQVPGWRGAQIDAQIHAQYEVRWLERQSRELDMYEHDPSRPQITTVHDLFPSRMKMHMCVVFAPWIPADLNATAPEQGLFCSTCLYTERQNVLYTWQSFREHLKECRVGPIDPVRKEVRQGMRGWRLSLDMVLTRMYY